MEEFRLPKLFMVSGYTVYFWSNENGEPIHVHVSKGKPTPNATKIWLTKSGGCILASNGSKISDKELNELMEFISAQFFLICAKWKQAFVIEEIKFYCQERQTDDAEKEFYGTNSKVTKSSKAVQKGAKYAKKAKTAVSGAKTVGKRVVKK